MFLVMLKAESASPLEALLALWCCHSTSLPPSFLLLLITASFSCMQAPIPVPDHAQSRVKEATGGFVSIVVLPRHVKNDSLDDFAWRLLSFHDHVHYHVKCFQVHLRQLVVHVKGDTLDNFAWRLLSFHDHVQYHVKCSQV